MPKWLLKEQDKYWSCQLAEDVEDLEDIDVANYILKKEEEEMLVEHFLALQLEENEAPAR